jgi:hypothetical protein
MGQNQDQDIVKIRGLVPSGHKIGQPAPIFRNISDEDINKWRAQFAGKKQ